MLLRDVTVSRLRKIWESALMDTCILQTRAEGSTGYGYGRPTYTDGTTTIPCWFEPRLKDESPDQVQNIDGYVIVKRSTSLNNAMRIKLTKLHGDAISQVYEIIGGPIEHHMGQKVRVKLVTDGSQS